MEENRSTRRRWFRFSLRTLFVFVTLVCVWLGYSANWISQRRAILRTDGISVPEKWRRPPRPLAPGGLWILGEEGFRAIIVAEQLQGSHDDLIERVKKLFPEANVTDGGGYCISIIPIVG